MNEPTWTTRDGRVLKVSEMTTNHIHNAIRMLKRQGCVSVREYNDVSTNPPCFQGEQAQLCADQMWFHWLDEYEPCIALDHFEDELRRRQIVDAFPEVGP